MPHPRRLATTSLAETLVTPGGPTVTVARRLVHRASVAEALLIGATSVDTDQLTICAERSRARRLHVSPDRSAHELLRATGRQLRVDTGHPVFFDHLPGHMPGMPLPECARRAVRARTRPARRTALSPHDVFRRQAELDLRLRIEIPGETGVCGADAQVVGRQGKSKVLECGVGSEGRWDIVCREARNKRHDPFFSVTGVSS